jgi:hypothetical protein
MNRDRRYDNRLAGLARQSERFDSDCPESAGVESTWSKLVKLFWAIYGLLLLAMQLDGVVAMMLVRIMMAPVALMLVIMYCLIAFPVRAALKALRLAFPHSRFTDDDWKFNP